MKTRVRHVLHLGLAAICEPKQAREREREHTEKKREERGEESVRVRLNEL